MIDTVQADQIEVGDSVRYQNEEFEVLEFVSDDEASVTYKMHSLDSGVVDFYQIGFDETVEILGV